MRDLYMEIGRFFVAFSHLQHAANFGIVVNLSRDRAAGEVGPDLPAWAAVAPYEAKATKDAFFALAFRLRRDSWAEGDFDLVRLAHKNFEKLIQERNRLAHRVWELDPMEVRLPQGVDAELHQYGFRRTQPTRHVPQSLSLSDIREFTRRIEQLRLVITFLGTMLLSDTIGTPSARFEEGDGWIQMNSGAQATEPSEG